MSVSSTAVKPGDKITGKVKLKVKHPVKARRLLVRLYAIRVSRGWGKNGYETRKDLVFEFPKELDGEKEYTDSEYEFEVTIPTALPKASINLFGLSINFGWIEWWLEAKLDIPFGRDIARKIRIYVPS